MIYAGVAYCIMVTTLAQLILRLGAARAAERVMNLTVMFGYALLFSVLIVSYMLMRFIEFKYFVVIMSSIYVTTMLAAFIFLKEKVNVYKVLGTVIISIGIAVFVTK